MNTSNLRIIGQLTSPSFNQHDLETKLAEFSQVFGWSPGYSLTEKSSLQSICNGHFIVDHGLEKSAVISFLQSEIAMRGTQENQLLGVSYNNLIDWHLFITNRNIRYVHNRSNSIPRTFEFTSESENLLTPEKFLEFQSVPSPQVYPNLEDLLIDTISEQRRIIYGELGGSIDISNIASLFNAIIFIRALEDYSDRNFTKQGLVEQFDENTSSIGKITDTLGERILSLEYSGEIADLLNVKGLQCFNALSDITVRNLFLSFYTSPKIPYRYDFAIMSKHALSRIYEKYVTMLSVPTTMEEQLFPYEAIDNIRRDSGTVYTPQFIANFFAQYAERNLTNDQFLKSQVLDPSCGSGIFLRTFAERMANLILLNGGKETDEIFNRLTGYDIDANAIAVTKLSLSLLHLILSGGKLATDLSLKEADFLQIFLNRTENNLLSRYDIIVANPPFISHDRLDDSQRATNSSVLENLAGKKNDIYLSFLKASIDLLAPGGYGLFVIPHSFLKNQSSLRIREYLLSNTWIRTLINISTIDVFNAGIYVVLIVFQKMKEIASPPRALIVNCKKNVEKALQAAVEHKEVKEEYYDSFFVAQDTLNPSDFADSFISPNRNLMINRIKNLEFVELREIFDVHQGVITGNDRVFLKLKDEIPKSEQTIWKRLIKDKEITKFPSSNTPETFCFYPYKDGRKLTLLELEKQFPKSLDLIRVQQSKSGVTNPRMIPANLGTPPKILGPKIITPHLIFLPRFGFDEKGSVLVSHSPYLVLKSNNNDLDQYYFYLAILNSTISAWFLDKFSDRIGGGYLRLEVKSLKRVLLPPISLISPVVAQRIILEYKNYLGANPNQRYKYEQSIDDLVKSIYKITEIELELMTD